MDAKLGGSVLDPIEKEIEETRERMEQRMAQIEDRVGSKVRKVKRAVDVPGMVRERPWVALGAAVGAGFLASRLVRGGGDDDHDGASRRRRARRERFEDDRPGLRERYGDEIAAVKTAAATLAVDAAKAYFGPRLPALAAAIAAGRRKHRAAAEEADGGGGGI